MRGRPGLWVVAVLLPLVARLLVRVPVVQYHYGVVLLLTRPVSALLAADQ